MKGVKFTPTPEQLQYLIDNFPNTRNADLAYHLGISMRTMSRIASDLGLSKSTEFLELRRKKAGDASRQWHRLHPKPPGYRIPRGEEFRFKKGTSIRTRQGEEAHRRAIEKGTAKRRDIIKKRTPKNPLRSSATDQPAPHRQAPRESIATILPPHKRLYYRRR